MFQNRTVLECVVISSCCHGTVAVKLKAKPHAFLNHFSRFTVEHVTENIACSHRHSFLTYATFLASFISKNMFNNSCWPSARLRSRSCRVYPCRKQKLALSAATYLSFSSTSERVTRVLMAGSSHQKISQNSDFCPSVIHITDV